MCYVNSVTVYHVCDAWKMGVWKFGSKVFLRTEGNYGITSLASQCAWSPQQLSMEPKSFFLISANWDCLNFREWLLGQRTYTVDKGRAILNRKRSLSLDGFDLNARVNHLACRALFMKTVACLSTFCRSHLIQPTRYSYFFSDFCWFRLGGLYEMDWCYHCRDTWARRIIVFSESSSSGEVYCRTPRGTNDHSGRANMDQLNT